MGINANGWIDSKLANPKSHTHPEEKSGRVCLAYAQEEMKIVANLKDKMTENK